MAALVFPPSPTVGQLYPNPIVAGIAQWEWNGTEWVVVSSGGGIPDAPADTLYARIAGAWGQQPAISATTPPATPQPGMLWFDSAIGVLFQYYQNAWVEIANATPTGAYLPLAGGTLTGNLTVNGGTTTVGLTASTANLNGGAMNINNAAGSFRVITYQSTGAANPPRWTVYADNTAESGSSAGSNFGIGAFTDAGVQSQAMSINRATLAVQFNGVVNSKGFPGGTWAPVGFVGEYQNVTVAAFNVPNNAWTPSATTLSLTAGLWQIWGWAFMQMAGSGGAVTQSIGVWSGGGLLGGSQAGPALVSGGLNNFYGTAGPCVMNLTATTVFNLAAWCGLNTGATCQCQGYLSAIRIH